MNLFCGLIINNNKLKISFALFPDVIKSVSQKFHIKLNTILNGQKVKYKIDSLKKKVLNDFLKLFKEATFLISADSLFQSPGAAATKERAPSVGSIFCVGGSSRALFFERRL